MTNRDDLVRDTYAHFGLAMCKAQVLEHGIEIDTFIDQQFENTLGQLVRELKKYVAVPADLSEVLSEALVKRNWLAHDYFREHATDFVTEIGCSRMISELEAVQRFFDDAGQTLGAIVRSIRERFGVTDEAIAAEVRNLVSCTAGLDG